MAIASSPPPARGAGADDARRRVLLDEFVTDRADEGVPEPVLCIDPVSLDAIPTNRGRHRIEDVEEAVARNLRSAEEARKALREEHTRLEHEASVRRKIEREVASLRREIERMLESENLRVAQARYAAEREARDEVLADLDQIKDEHARALQEVERLRRALDGDRALMSEYSDRLREEQQAKMQVQAEADRALEACRAAEQRLELSTEAMRRRADEELLHLAEAEAALRDALAERDSLAAELLSLTVDGDRGADPAGTVADLEHLIRELEGALNSERARTDDAVAHVAELTEELDALRLHQEDDRRSIAVVEQLEAELEGAVAAHGAAVDRVRALDEQRTRLEGRIRELTDAHAELIRTVAGLECDLDVSTRERDELLADVDRLRTERAGELASVREASRSEVRELEHQLSVAEVERDALVREVSDLRAQLAELAASTAAPGVEVRELEARLGDAIAVRDTYLRQVRDLEASLTESSERREAALRTASELERALSQEQARAHEAETELRRLRSEASAGARADVTGRAEPAVVETDTTVQSEPRSPAPEPIPAPEADPEPRDESGPPPVERLSAMAELTAIASIENDTFRRRR
ncbi:MAG: hypothetical protein ACRDV7_00545 [Acidimicrobiia bacterium]